MALTKKTAAKPKRMHNLDDLKTVRNFAEMHRVTHGYINQCIALGKITPTLVDGKVFVDFTQHPALPSKTKHTPR
jgi:hypothetical protein